MSASNATITPPNIVLTPMQVVFNGIDVGGTEGGVTVSPKYKLADIKVDQYGDTIVDAVVSGQGYGVKFTLAETKNKANWAIAFPHAQLVGSAPNQSEYFAMNIGDKVSYHAFVLKLHPLANLPNDYSGDIMMYKAVTMSASEVKYGPDKQTGLAVDFLVLPDTSVIPPRFMLLGDPSIGLVNASFTDPVPGSNVGNGTITGVGVTNQYTATETITVKCVGASSGNDFYISGSVSGPLGEMHIGAASATSLNFSSNPISFTLNQGSTQFAYGDLFTIATSASNYH